jgi:hypothetical protein
MNKLVAASVALFAWWLGSPAFAQCSTPAMVEIPDGATATLEEMLAAQTAVRNYLAEMEEYLACVNEEIEAQDEETPVEVRTMMIERHNLAVTDMETVAARFNEERIAYQEANPSD